jgi:hypothetical protein
MTVAFSAGPPGWPERFEPDELVTFKSPMVESMAAWWVGRFRVQGRPFYPRNLAERLIAGLPGTPACLFSAILPLVDRVSVELQGVEEGSGQLWFAGQTLEFQPERHLFSDLMTVAEDRQRGGIARRMLANCYDLATDLDLEKLRLKAAWVGSYAWLKFGFVPDAQDWQGPLKAHLTEQLLRVKPFIPAGAFNRSLRALASDEPKAAWVLADDRTPVTPSAVQTRSLTLGQALLADCGATWYGTIRLDDSEAVTRFRDYVDFEP